MDGHKRRPLHYRKISKEAQRRELIGDYAAAKKAKQELLTVQANLNALLPQNEKERIRSDAERS